MRRALPLVLLAATAAHAAPPPPDARTAIIEYFRQNFVYPETTQWRFTRSRPFVDGGMVFCGQVNFENSLRRYEGFTPFYAVVENDHVREGMVMERAHDDPTGDQLFKVRTLCGGL